MKTNEKILYFDLEFCPDIQIAYGRKHNFWTPEENVLTPAYLINFSYAWATEKLEHDIKSRCLWDNNNQWRRSDEYADYDLVLALWELLDEADVVVAHNADRFDVKKANMLFLKHGLNPPSPYRVIDTLKIAKKHFGFESNSLKALAIRLGLTAKLDGGGTLTMHEAADGCPKAQAHLAKYCNVDVEVLIQIHRVMLGWNTLTPNFSTNHSCSHCGSEHVQKRGIRKTDTGKSFYQRYQCTECGGWSKGPTTRLPKEDIESKLYPVRR